MELKKRSGVGRRCEAVVAMVLKTEGKQRLGARAGSPNATCEQRWTALFWRITHEILDVSSAKQEVIRLLPDGPLTDKNQARCGFER
jgi:hypothetical protein